MRNKILLWILAFFVIVNGVSAWWNPNWQFAYTLEITNNDNSAHIDEPLVLNVSYINCSSPTKNDLRLIYNDTVLVKFQWYNNSIRDRIIVNYNTSASTVSTKYKIYCGNPSTTDISGGLYNVFEDFNSPGDLAVPWNLAGKSSIETGYARLNGTASWSDYIVTVNPVKSNGYFETKVWYSTVNHNNVWEFLFGPQGTTCGNSDSCLAASESTDNYALDSGGAWCRGGPPLNSDSYIKARLNINSTKVEGLINNIYVCSVNFGADPTDPIKIYTNLGNGNHIKIDYIYNANLTDPFNTYNPSSVIVLGAQLTLDMPVASAGQDQLAETNSVVTLDGSASFDPEGNNISYSWTQLSGPGVTLEGSNTVLPYFTPTVVGIYDFQLIVNNSMAYSDPDTVQVRVTLPNNPPWIDPVIPDQTRDEDSLPWQLDLSLYENDEETPDDLELDWSVIGVNTSLFTTSFDINKNIITFNPKPDTSGFDTITLILTDLHGTSDTQDILVTLNSVYDPISISPIPDPYMTENIANMSFIDLDVYISNPENNPIIWSYSGDTYLTVNIDSETNIVSLIPQPGWSGNETITFTADDGITQISEYANVHVHFVDDPSYIDPVIPDQTKDEDSPSWTLDLTNYKHDPDTPLSQIIWLAKEYDTSLITITFEGENNDIARFTPFPNAFGSTQVNFSLQGGGGSPSGDMQWVTITLNSVNDASEITPTIPDQTKNEDDPSWILNLSNYLFEPDSDPVTWSVSGVDISLFTANLEGDNSDILRFTPVPDAFGSDVITISVEDPFGEGDNQDITVTLNPMTEPPYISPTIPDQTKDEDILPWQLDLSLYGNDIEDSEPLLYWSVAGVDTSIVNVLITEDGDNHDIATFTPALNAFGSDMITFILHDSEGKTAQQDITLTLNPVNDAPVINGTIPDQTKNEDSSSWTLDLSSYAYDIDGDALTWSVSGVDTSLFTITFEGDNQDIARITPVPDAFGSDVVTFFVQDPSLEGDNQDVTITLLPVNDMPIADAGPDQTVQRGSLTNLDGSASYDVDFDPLTYSWTQTAGASITLEGNNTDSPYFTPLITGSYTFRLVVNDGINSSTSDYVTVDVQDTGGPIITFITPQHLDRVDTSFPLEVSTDEDSVCRYSIDGDNYDIFSSDTFNGMADKVDFNLNYGEEIADVFPGPLGNGNLPVLLADGRFTESTGENANDIVYRQKIRFVNTSNANNGAQNGVGQFTFDADDDGIHQADNYLMFDAGIGDYVYIYELTFDTPLQYSTTPTHTPYEDLFGASIIIQGDTFIISNVSYDMNYQVDGLTLLNSGDEYALKNGYPLKKNGVNIDVAQASIKGTIGSLQGLNITNIVYDEEYKPLGSNITDTVFGNFIIGLSDITKTTEAITLKTSYDGAEFTFRNKGGYNVTIPLFVNDTASGTVNLGDDFTASNCDGRLLLEGDNCAIYGGDLSSIEGVMFLLVTADNNTHLMEISDITTTTMENVTDIRDITYGVLYADIPFQSGQVSNMVIGSLGTIQLYISGSGSFSPVDVVLGTNTRIETFYGANLTIVPRWGSNLVANGRDNATHTTLVLLREENKETNELVWNLSVYWSAANSELRVNPPELLQSQYSQQWNKTDIRASAPDKYTKYYVSEWGTAAVYDSSNRNNLTLLYPDNQVYGTAYLKSLVDSPYTDAHSTQIEGLSLAQHTLTVQCDDMSGNQGQNNIIVNVGCDVPTDAMTISSDTIFCEGNYNLPNGMTLTSSNINIDCNNAHIYGNNEGNGFYGEGQLPDGYTITDAMQNPQSVLDNMNYVLENSTFIENVTIRNCDISNYDNAINLTVFKNLNISNNVLHNNNGAGIFTGSVYSTISGNELYNNKNGIIGFGVNNAISGNNAHDNDAGIADAGLNNTISYNNAYANNLGILSIGVNNIISYNNASANTNLHGIGVLWNNDSRIFNNIADDNFNAGIGMSDVYNVRVFDNTANRNNVGISISGLFSYGRSEYNWITNNTAINNTHAGIKLSDWTIGMQLAMGMGGSASGHRITNNYIQNNHLDNGGAYDFGTVDFSTGTDIFANVITSNDFYGLGVYEVTDSNIYCVNTTENNYYNAATGPQCPTAPIFYESTIYNISATDGDTVTISPAAYDPDGGNVIITISDPIGNDGIWYPMYSDIGTHLIEINATDDENELTTRYISVDVAEGHYNTTLFILRHNGASWIQPGDYKNLNLMYNYYQQNRISRGLLNDADLSNYVGIGAWCLSSLCSSNYNGAGMPSYFTYAQANLTSDELVDIHGMLWPLYMDNNGVGDADEEISYVTFTIKKI